MDIDKDQVKISHSVHFKGHSFLILGEVQDKFWEEYESEVSEGSLSFLIHTLKSCQNWNESYQNCTTLSAGTIREFSKLLIPINH